MLEVLFQRCHFICYTSTLSTDGFKIDPIPKKEKKIRIILMA